MPEIGNFDDDDGTERKINGIILNYIKLYVYVRTE